MMERHTAFGITIHIPVTISVKTHFFIEMICLDQWFGLDGRPRRFLSKVRSSSAT
jgi:hypothetical protein